ncbi:MAG: hypothetical protein ACOC2H_06320 [Spirochaetota bacterium]
MNPLAFSRYISRAYSVILLVLMVLLSAASVAESLFGIFSRSDPEFLYTFAILTAQIGTVLALFSVLFYPLRKAGEWLNGRHRFFSSATYISAATVAAHIHPVVALLGFFLVTLHGFIFLKVVYRMHVTIVNAFGISALVMFAALLVTGTRLRVYVSHSRLRRFHLLFAVLFLALYYLHRSVMHT